VDEQRQMRALTREMAMDRLGSVQLGRVVFTSRALPAIRPVSHLVDGGDIVIRSHEGPAIVTAANAGRSAVVAYEADQIDPVTHLGWSVIVTGLARLVEDPLEIARYQDALRPWGTRETDQVIRIRAEFVTGFELVASDVLAGT